MPFFTSVAEAAPGRTVLAQRAIDRGTRIEIEDITTDSLSDQFGALARLEGFRGVVATPITDRSNRPLGAAVTYFPEARLVDEGRLRLSDLFVHQAGEVVATLKWAVALRAAEITRQIGGRWPHPY